MAEFDLAEDVLLGPLWLVTLVALILALLVLRLLSWALAPEYFSLADKTVVITGGSSGIGLAIAQGALRRGARVALLARRQDVLDQARVSLVAGLGQGGIHDMKDASRVSCHSADVTSDGAVSGAVAAAAAAHGGRVDVLVCSAGDSQPRRFEDCSAAEFEHVYKVNVVGVRNAVAACLPFMAGRNPAVPVQSGGRIALVSSQAGQVGIYGFTAYSASKFALQGLAQALGQELHTRGIVVSQVFPPDTDTPLLAAENLRKPLVTKLLSESTAMVSPAVVAAACLDGVCAGRVAVGVGFDGWMLATLTAGMGPAGTLGDAVAQFATMGLWRLVALFYVQWWHHGVIARHDTGAPGPHSAQGR